MKKIFFLKESLPRRNGLGSMTKLRKTKNCFMSKPFFQIRCKDKPIGLILQNNSFKTFIFLFKTYVLGLLLNNIEI